MSTPEMNPEDQPKLKLRGLEFTIVKDAPAPRCFGKSS